MKKASKKTKAKIQAAPASKPARQKHNSTLRPVVKIAVRAYAKKHSITESYATEKLVVKGMQSEGIKIK